MNTIWIAYTGITAFYIIIIAIYFWRRSKKHELELQDVLQISKTQLEKHRKHVHERAGQRINKAMMLIKQLHRIAANLEIQAKEEYTRLVQAANDQAQEILKEAKQEAQAIKSKADEEFDDYRQKRQQEIEADMVRLVMSVTQKVIKKSLTPQDHQNLILQSLEEVKAQKEKM